MRTVLHCDLNNFFASVELLSHPELAGVPVAVGGNEEERHGIVLAKNYIAKSFGVQTAESLWQARQKCPGLVVLPAHYEKYVSFSRRARAVYDRYTDMVEPFGIDECWLDVSGSTVIFGSGKDIADNIRREIREELHITASVGVSFNKVFAKLGSDMKKPDATTVIDNATFRDTVWHLPAGDLLGVGASTQRALRNLGLLTIGDVAKTEPSLLRLVLGKSGEHLWRCANGLDNSPVLRECEQPPPKSIGRSTTQPFDLTTADEVRRTLIALSERVAHSLRENRALARTIQLTMRDGELVTTEHQRRLTQPTRLVGQLVQTGMELFEERRTEKIFLRSIGIRACELVREDEGIQLSLEYDAKKLAKLELLESRVDELRARYGRDALKRAAVLMTNDSAQQEGQPFGRLR